MPKNRVNSKRPPDAGAARPGILVLRIAALLGIPLLWVSCNRGAPGPGARQSVETGWQQYSAGAFDAAEATFTHLARPAAGNPEERERALYGLATVANLRRPGEDPAQAARIYQEILSGNPRGEYAAWSLLALARMQALVPVGGTVDGTALRAAYQRVVDRFPFQTAGEEALMCQQVMLVQTFQAEDARAALATLEKFVATHPGSRFLGTAHGLMADCARVLAEPERRLAEEIAALEIREREARRRWEKQPVGEFAFNDSGAFFKIANLAEREVGDFEAARKYYRLFLHQNPTEKRGFYVQQSLARMDRAESETRADLARELP